MSELGKKILIVEDEESMLQALADKFSNEGFGTIEAKDGEQGLEVALKDKPDLILLDIILPKMDGMTMMKKLREANLYGQKVPIILLTNLNADDQIIQGVTKDEPAFYLVKTDYTINDVVAKVRETLKLPLAGKPA